MKTMIISSRILPLWFCFTTTTAGTVWPAPQHTQLGGNGTVYLDPAFAFTSVGADSDVLAAAFKRYGALLRLGARHGDVQRC